MIDVAIILMLLHGPDGSEIRVNPDQITHLRSAKPNASKDEKIFHGSPANCMINLADGKFVTVVETCEQVKGMMKETR